jgi:hypothetical protein
MAKIIRKPLPPVMSWWSERRNILASLKPKPVRAGPKPTNVKAKAKPKPKSIRAKKPVKAKKVTKMKKTTKVKKTKAKRTK